MITEIHLNLFQLKQNYNLVKSLLFDARPDKEKGIENINT